MGQIETESFTSAVLRVLKREIFRHDGSSTAAHRGRLFHTPLHAALEKAHNLARRMSPDPIFSLISSDENWLLVTRHIRSRRIVIGSD
ncbi:hypothetical protein [Mycobacterium malmoense]|uniref:hypothetical protein n=1 Tax=Mycobacterium malmoense TaxID=1780 RepID=UPI0011306411|nr:hypothetical protein [Mycobacterium malmoense]